MYEIEKESEIHKASMTNFVWTKLHQKASEFEFQ